MKRPRCPLSWDSILLVLTVVSVLLGIVVGIGIKFGKGEENPLSPREVGYIKYPGELFLRMLKLVILPLITSSLITSLASLDTKTAGRIGLFATGFYFCTTLLAVITGIILVLAIRPGDYGQHLGDQNDHPNSCEGTIPIDTMMDLGRNMFPENIVEATFRGTGSCVKYRRKNDSKTLSSPAFHKMLDAMNSTGRESEELKWWVVPFKQRKEGMNILGLVVFSIAFGIILNVMGPDGAPLAAFFKALEVAMMKLISVVIWISPVGIFFLIVSQIVGMHDLVAELKRLGMYMLTVLAGLFIHGFVSLSIVYFAVVRKNPVKFIYGMMQALLTALGTASSSATMPLTLRCLEDKIGVDPRVTRFMIPLGATINMDGTALYEAVAALYIAQSIGEDMGLGEVVLISLTATLASIGAAGIPSAGLVTMVMVLIAAGLPPEYFALIVPIDWFLDRIRTTINVLGDSYGTAVVQRLCQSQLFPKSETVYNNNQENPRENDMEPPEIPLEEATRAKPAETFTPLEHC